MKYAIRSTGVFIMLLGFALGMTLFFGLSPLQADQPPAAPTPGATPLPSVSELGKGPWVVRAYYTDRAMIDRLSAWKEPWEVNRQEGYVVVEAFDFFEYLKLESIGFRLEVDEKLTAEMNRPRTRAPGQIAGIPGYPCYRTVEETFATATQIVADHPNLAKWIDVGDSWEKTQDTNNGYDMMVLRLTNEQVAIPKPKVFIMTSVHAREYTPAELNTRFAEYLVSNYGVDPDVTWLLDYNEFHLMLQANPDGRKHAEGGVFWRKNTNENYCSLFINYRGADLNRNFEFYWHGCGNESCSSSVPCATTYRGPSAASEPETQSIQNYVSSIFPDMRDDPLTSAAPITTSGVFLDIHSYSELILWPWGFTHDVAPNGIQIQTLGRKFAYFNAYHPEQAIGLYPTDGTTDDFGYGELGLPSYTFELGTSFFQNCTTFENTILPDNLPALTYAGKAARRPYQTPAGPDSLNLSISAAVVNPGQAVTLSATLNDARYNNQNGTEPTQNIAAAVYYIDTPHWITGATVTTYTMSPVDGSFNSSVEDVTAAIDTTDLSAGRHTIFVRGQDTDGNWGVYSAIFLYITEPAAPTAEFASNSPVGLGMSVLFTNLSIGEPTPTYAWDFGDGTGSSVAVSPVYTYANIGTFTVTLVATNSLGSDSVSHTVTVEEPTAIISLSPLDFKVALITGDTSARTLSIGNTGTAVLTWTLSVSPGASWLGASPLSGAIAPSGSETVNLDFDAAGLAANAYTATLRLVSNDPKRPMSDVPVSLQVTDVAEPVINITPTSFSLSLNSDETTTRTLSIANVGTAALDWGPLAFDPAASWVTPSVTSGTVLAGDPSEQVILTFDGAGLPGGIGTLGFYTTTLKIPSNHITRTASVALIVSEVRNKIYLPIVQK